MTPEANRGRIGDSPASEHLPFGGNVDLLTGQPEIGKSTAIHNIIDAVGPAQFGGFFTEEIRSAEGERVGFRLVTVDGQQSGVIAHLDKSHVAAQSDLQIGPFWVDTSVLDFIGIPAMQRAAREGKIVVIDEIGPMQLLHGGFYESTRQIIASGAKILGTIVFRDYPQANELKTIPGVRLHVLTEMNRDIVVQNLIREYLSS